MDRSKELSQLNTRLFAEYGQEHLGISFPTLSAIKNQSKTNQTRAEATARLSELQSKHSNDLDTLLSTQASLYIEDMIDRYICYDETEFVLPEDPADWPAEKRAQASAVTEAHCRPYTALTLHFSDELDNIMSSHDISLRHALLAKKQLERQDETARREEHAKLPQTINEYRVLPNAEKKRSIASYLVASDSSSRERILSKMKWPSLSLAPLMRLYASDTSFATEVQNFVKTFETRDPRSRPSWS